MNKLVRIIIFILLVFAISTVAKIPVKAAGTTQIIETNISPLKLDILSSKTIGGTAGDYVTVKAQITNYGRGAINGITTYLSLVDMQNKLPVDLEDWSAEKGLYIGSIDIGQTLPLNWKIHFVKAGNYSLTVIADVAGQQMPQASSLIYFDVQPKRNLNPGQVLPVALGTPLVIVLLLMLANYRRKRG